MINPKSQQAYQLLHEGILSLQRAESQGLRIDVDYVTKKKAQLLRKMQSLEQEFKSSSFFRHWQHSSKSAVNINSHIQLSHFLYGVKKLKPEKLTDTGKGSTDEEALTKLNIPELNLLAEKNKLKKAYDVLDGFDREQVDGVLHTSFNLHLAASFRSSSNSPNMQNTPKRDEEMMQACRKAVFPRVGHQFLEIDFSGAEVRVSCAYHKDSTMIKYVTDSTTDMHRDLSSQIFKMDSFKKEDPTNQYLRFSAKNGFVFAEFYGDYYKNCAIGLCNLVNLPKTKWKPGMGVDYNGGKLSDHLISKGIISFDSFTVHLKKIEDDFWGNRFQEYAAWKDMYFRLYQKYGYVDTYLGFRFSGLMDKKQVCNYPIQSSAFHCLLFTFIRLDKVMREENWDSRLVSQIHDSVLIDVHPDELQHVIEVAKKIVMIDLPKEWDWINVPLEIDAELTGVDESWALKKKYKI